MPVRDAAGTLERALASVLAQTFADFELVIVDDGSTDGTGEVLARAARSDARVRVLSTPPRGIVPALNEGLAAARGELIARMDADDESHPERLSEQVSFLDRYPEHGLVATRVTFGGDRARAAGYLRHVDWQNALVDEADIRRERFIESPFAHPSVMFRRSLVLEHGGYRDGPFPEDYELWLRWMGEGVRMIKLERALLTWHDLPGRLSRTDPRYDPEAFYRVKARWLAKVIPAGRALHVWGAGRPTRRRARYLLKHGARIAAWVDIDPAKHGKTYNGVPVIAPDVLPEPELAFVLGYVSSWGAREHIRGELARRHYVEGRDFLMAA